MVSQAMSHNMYGNQSSFQSTQSRPTSKIVESKTNLIINYLPQTMGQDDILSLFSRVAHVDFCKLIRDKITGQSLGYAFVNYHTPEGAEKAVKTLNGLRLQNKVIKVSYARPSTDAIKGANLYISGLPTSMTAEELENMFASYGTIINARILIDKNSGMSKGVGFVRYDKRFEAEKAIAALDNKCVADCQTPLTIKFANHPNNLPPLPFANRTSTPTLLGNQGTRQFNNPASTYSSRNSTPTPPALHSSWQSPTTEKRNRAAPRERKANLDSYQSSNCGNVQDYCLFVYNLGPETEEATLWQIFGPMGPVKSVKVAHNPQTNKCRGYGFVKMGNYENAVAAIKALNGATFKNRVLHVSFKIKKE